MAENKLGSINLNLLMALDALLTEGNVTRAAERLGVTQSAMSHSLQKLREIFDDPLLVRGPSGMAPTARANELIEPIRRGLAELSRALRESPSFDPAAASRTFTLAMGDLFALLLLPPLLEIARREAPGIDLTIRPADGRREPELLHAGEIDGAIAVLLGDRASIRSKRLFTERFVCIVRKGHPDVKGPLSLDLFVRLPHALISPRGSGASYVDEALAKLGRQRRIALRVPYFLAAPFVIARSDLVLTLPERLAHQLAKGLPIDILPPPVELTSFSSYLIWHERDEADPAHTWLRGAITRAAGAVDQPAMSG